MATVVDVLETHSPAAVATFHQMHEAAFIARVRIVVAGEEIAEFVEGKLLRIPHAGGENLELRAIGIAAHD
jgi:hypothetical protein